MLAFHKRKGRERTHYVASRRREFTERDLSAYLMPVRLRVDYRSARSELRITEFNAEHILPSRQSVRGKAYAERLLSRDLQHGKTV